MSNELREAVLVALAGEGLTLVEIYDRIGEDSRRTLAMLHVLAGQKLVTCAREEGRGMVWSLTEDADDAADGSSAPPPSPPPPRQAPEPPRAAPAAHRPAESNASVILRWIAGQNRPVLVREIIAGTGIASQSVYNTLTDLTRGGRVMKGGQYMRTTYCIPGQCVPATKQPDPPPPVDKPAVNSETVAQPVRQPAPLLDMTIVLQVSVPMSKASAVLRAVEQALAA